MNVRTYSFVKYLGTLGSLLLLLAPILGFLQEWSYIGLKAFNFGHNFLFKSATALPVTLWVLEIVGIICIVGYVYVRTLLKKKSPYTYTKKDNLKLNIAFILYASVIVLSFIYVIISCGIFGYPKIAGAGTKAAYISSWGPHNSPSRVVALMITFAPFIVFEFAGMVCASIFESMSRMAEQEFLNNQREDAKNKNDISVSTTGTKRTKEAQMLFEDEKEDKLSKNQKKKSKSKKQEIKSEEYIEDQKDLEDFFNEDDDDKKKKGSK